MSESLPHNLLIDNSSESLSMATYLKKCISEEGITNIQIATGYWDVLGMSMLISELSAFLEKDNARVQLLIGKDPYVYTSLLQNPKYKDANYPSDYIRTDINELELKEEYEQVIQLLLKHLATGKLQVRIYQKNAGAEVEFLHSKCYIFFGEKTSMGIIGSSNFTQKGLLGNSELNYLETDPTRVTARPQVGSTVKGHICWFEEKWAQSQEWTQEFLEQILKRSKIYKQIQKKSEGFSPYEQYIKLLQLQFGMIVDKELGQQIESYLPTNVQNLSYQIEAVKRCISIMQEHGGFMLGDVVGLGKTIVGTLIVKHFLSTPQDEGREHKVLIVSPPAILSNWKNTLKLFDKEAENKISPYIDFVTTGRIGNLTDDDDLDGADDDSTDSGDFAESLQEKSYGLILVDESHKFRNSGTQMYQSLDELISKIGLETGIYPYIGLLSATPQNNRPNDLKNQIYLFARNRNDSTLKKAEGGNLERFFRDVNQEYELLISRNVELPEGERHDKLEALSKKLRDCVLCDILERRTRTDVERHYEQDMKAQGIVFPKIVGPNNIDYVMSDELAELFFDTMTIIAPTEKDKLQTDKWLGYFRYRGIEYFVDPKIESKYKGRGNRSVTDVSRQLATIMQIRLVKRLESSLTAFTKSLLNLRRYTENMIKMWENDTIFVCPQIDVNKELDHDAKSKKRGTFVSFEDCVAEIRIKIQNLTKEGKNNKAQNAEYRRADFKEEYIIKLKQDLSLISNLYDRWAMNSEDPKFDAFKENLKPELFNPAKNTSQKLVIFSEAIDTVESLCKAVKSKGFKPLVVTAATRHDLEQVITENFDANYKGEWKDDYNVIITTEVLAEGVNLHRANVILNYDTPWNSTRLMQRIGRVNRIGSREPEVYVYNFMPSAQGNEQIQLVRKAHTKLQSFHVLFGEDSKIFSEAEEVKHYEMSKAVAGEESPLLPYVSELKRYKENFPERYAEIEKAEGTCWQIAQAKEGTAYFVVKAPRNAKLAIAVNKQVDSAPKPQVISYLDLLKRMQVAPEAKPLPLPSDWDALSKRAIDAYNQYFVRISQTRAGDKSTLAKGFIVELYKSEGISPKSKILLEQARKLVDRGSFDIIKKILHIKQELSEKDTRLFTLEQQDIDDILEQEIGKLVARVKAKQGEPTIILGTIK